MPRSILAAFRTAARGAQLAPLVFVVACVPAPRAPSNPGAEETARVAVASANLEACSLEPRKEKTVDIFATFNGDGRIDSVAIQHDKEGAVLDEPLRSCIVQAVKGVAIAPFDSWQLKVEVRTTVVGTANGRVGWGFNRGAAAAALGGVDVSPCALDGASSGHVTVQFRPTGTAIGAHVDSGPSKGSPAAACVEAAFAKVRVPPFVSEEGKSVKVGKQFRL